MLRWGQGPRSHHQPSAPSSCPLPLTVSTLTQCLVPDIYIIIYISSYIYHNHNHQTSTHAEKNEAYKESRTKAVPGAGRTRSIGGMRRSLPPLLVWALVASGGHHPLLVKGSSQSAFGWVRACCTTAATQPEPSWAVRAAEAQCCSVKEAGSRRPMHHAQCCPSIRCCSAVHREVLGPPTGCYAEARLARVWALHTPAAGRAQANGAAVRYLLRADSCERKAVRPCVS